MNWIQGWLPTMPNFDKFLSVMIEQANNASGGAFMNWIQGVAPRTQPNVELNFSHRSCDSFPACESGEIFQADP